MATSASTLASSPFASGALDQEAVSRMDRLGLQLQQAVRTVDQHTSALTEPVDLLAACRQAATGWQVVADAGSVTLRVGGSPSTLVVNAAAFEQTLDMLVEHGVACGESVTLEVLATGSPLRPLVRVGITLREVSAPDGLSPPREVDELLPLLATWLAQGSGLLLLPSRAGKLVTLLLSLPEPVVLGASVSEGWASEDGSLLPHTPVAVGRRILIVDPNAASRLKAHALLTEAGMFADAVENIPQARAALRDGPPDLVISGLPTHGSEMAELVDEMRAARPALRVIELVDTKNAFAFSLPEADAPGRISRDELEAHLTMAVSEEIDGARPA